MKIRRIKRPLKKPLRKPSTKAKRIGKTNTERYRSDPDFRLKALENQRNYYRKKVAKNFEIVSPLRSLDYFTEMAELMEVEYQGRVFKAPCFTKTKAAELLQVSSQTFWRQSSGKDATIPEPVLLARFGKRELIVYHLEELRLMLTIIGEHKRRFAYYRKDHVETKQRLFTAIEELRQTWETNQSWQSAKQDDPQRPRKPKLPRRKPRS